MKSERRSPGSATWRAGVLLLVMALVASACGSSGDSGESTSTTQSGETTTPAAGEETTTTGDGEMAGGEISFFGWDVADLNAGLGKGFDGVRVAFEAQNEGASVTFDAVSFDEFVSAATTRARAGELGDVVEMLPGLNHSPVFPALVVTSRDDWGPLAEELTGWGGGVIDPSDPDLFAGVPIGGQGVIWYYNKALFEEAGLDPDAPPETWDEFAAAADALLAAGITPIAASGADSFLAWWAWSSFSPQFFSSEEDVLAIRSGEMPLTDERVLMSLQPVHEMYENGWWNDNYADVSFTDMEAAFINGEVAMIPGIITSIVNWVVWDEQMGTDAYGVFGAPLRDDALGDGQFFNPTLIFGINADSENPELAQDFVAFMASREGQEILLTESGQFPNRSDVDIEAVSGSPGASAIQSVIEERGAMDVIQNQFSAAAQGEAFQKLTQAIVSGDLETFLNDLQVQQQG